MFSSHRKACPSERSVLFGKQISIEEICEMIGCSPSNDGMQRFTSDWNDPFVPTNDEWKTYFHEVIFMYLCGFDTYKNQKITNNSDNSKNPNDFQKLYNSTNPCIAQNFKFDFDLNCNYYIGIPVKVGESVVDLINKVKVCEKYVNINEFILIMCEKYVNNDEVIDFDDE
jgi:hypothetical protein